MRTLSPRLTAVANLVTLGHKIADIGTDHAYVPISLLQQKKIPYALATDIHHGPLQMARENVKEAKLTDFIEIRQSNGLMNLKPHEVDSIVVAGIGGHLMINILLGNREVTRSLKECILQPQSEIEKVRSFLVSQGFTFIKEEMIEDAKKYYSLMKVSPPPTSRIATNSGFVREKWSDANLKFGKLLLESQNPTLKRFLLRELTIKEKILKKIEQETAKHIRKRQKEIRKEIESIREGLSYFEKKE